MANIIETFPKGGGATSLSNLTDVELTSPAEGDLLQRNGSGKWVNSAVIPQKVAGLQKTGCVNRLQNTADSIAYGGITYTVNANKSVTTSGIATAQGSLIINEWVSDGSMQGLKLVGCPAGGSNSKYHLGFYNVTKGIETSDFGDGAVINNDFAGDTVRAYIRVRNGADLSTPVTFNPMITPDLSATYADFQPYSMTNMELTEAVSGGYLYEKYDYIAVFGDGAKTVNSLLKEVIDTLNAYIGSITDRSIEISKCEVQGIINAPTQDSRIYTASVNTLVFGKSSIEIASGKLETATIRCDTTKTNCYATSYKFDTTPSTTKSQYGQNVLANGNYVRLYYKQYKKIV